MLRILYSKFGFPKIMVTMAQQQRRGFSTGRPRFKTWVMQYFCMSTRVTQVKILV